nr:hypothetical protein [Pandoravirus aubagnensis]
MEDNQSMGMCNHATRPRHGTNDTGNEKQDSGDHESMYFNERARAMASSKRWASEGDLVTKAPARKHQRREMDMAGRALVTLVTTDGATMILDVSPHGRFAARFPSSHLLDRRDGEDDSGSRKGGNHARHCEIALPVDRASLVPVYAYMTIDSADFGPCGAIDTNGLIASSLCLCIDRLDSVRAAADALGVPEAATALCRWADLAAPDPASYAITLEPDAYGIAAVCTFAPRDPVALAADMGPDAAKRLCDTVARQRMGTDVSPAIRYVRLARLDEPLRARIACICTDAGIIDTDSAAKVGTPIRRQMPFLLATSDLPDVDGAYARARRVLTKHSNMARGEALVAHLDDLCCLARQMPGQVRVDNPYHIMAALAACSDIVESGLGAKALTAAVDGNVNLLGLLADAAHPGLDVSHAVRALTDAHLGKLCLDPYQLHKVDQAIRAYYAGGLGSVDPPTAD